MAQVVEPVDLRSDTVTRPGPEMRRAMADAPVGDDVYREDPTINLLQDRVAELLGKEAALFVPSGTMSNQICLRTLTSRGDEVIVHEKAHILNFEGGSAAALSNLQLRALPGILGLLHPVDVERAVRSKGEHFPRTGAVEIENTHNSCGGTIWPVERMKAVADVARTLGIPVHLDGARLWNAHVASGTSLAAYAANADSVSVCFSKGLGAPVGSALAGSLGFVEEARYNRKRYGGAMRQAGILAAAALYALDHNIQRLAVDHDNAIRLAGFLREVPKLEITHPVQTNIVIIDVSPLQLTGEQVLVALKEHGVLCGLASPECVRFVTHMDVSSRQIEVAGEVAAHVLASLSAESKAARGRQ